MMLILKETGAEDLDGNTVYLLLDGDEVIGEGSREKLDDILDDLFLDATYDFRD